MNPAPLPPLAHMAHPPPNHRPPLPAGSPAPTPARPQTATLSRASSLAPRNPARGACPRTFSTPSSSRCSRCGGGGRAGGRAWPQPGRGGGWMVSGVRPRRLALGVQILANGRPAERSMPLTAGLRCGFHQPAHTTDSESPPARTPTRFRVMPTRSGCPTASCSQRQRVPHQ